MLSLVNFANSFTPVGNMVINNTSNINNGKCKYPNLAPLACDTVSFKRSEKDLKNTKFSITKNEAEKINKDALRSQNYLEKRLNAVLGGLIKEEGKISSDDKPIERIAYRLKTPESIREKSATRRWATIDEVKSGMTDIIGARIILDKADRTSVDKVINCLAEAERNSELEITEIENYRPEPELDDNGDIKYYYDYASRKALIALKQECDKKGKCISKKDEDVPTGYMAIHLLTKLPNGYTGEIQIIGKHVAELKNIEDICYKYKCGKKIEDKYYPFEKALKPLSYKNDIMLQREFNKYTREAYIYQRNKEPNNDDTSEFLQIPDDLPISMDFNNLAQLKEDCDRRSKKPRIV